MNQRYLLVFIMCALCIIPLVPPNTNNINTLSTPKKLVLLNNINSSDFYLYDGRTNNFVANLNESNAGPTFQSYYGTPGNGGDYYIRYNWQDIVGGATAYNIMYPNHPGNLVKIQWLHDHGIKVSIKVLGGHYNPLDIYYNSTYKQEVINQGIQYLQTYSYINEVDEIHIGDEAPATLFGPNGWEVLPADATDPLFSKYNTTLHDETGIWMRTDYSSNLTESWIFQNWLANKTMTAMNSIYYGLKQAFPTKQIAWDTMPWPGFEPTLLKGDYAGGGYYTNDFRTFYSEIRATKLAQPNVPVYSVITGTSDVPLDVQQQFFWTDYFAGGAGVMWAGGGSGTMWNSIGDYATLANYEFHNNLDKIAASLPVLDPKAQVLQINEVSGCVTTPVVGFRQYDASTELQAGSPSFSLSQYKIVAINEQYLMTDAMTNKLTNYFNSGGNIIFKGWHQVLGQPINASGQPRTTYFPAEIGSSIKYMQQSNSVLVNFQNSMFNSIIPNVIVSNRLSINITNSPDWIPIPVGAPEEALGYYPLALYHNSSNPQSGYMLYYGFAANSDNNFYIPFLRDYVQNFLNLNDLVTPATNPNILVSTSVDNANRTIIGIIPDATSSYEHIPVNITRRNLPQTNVWDYEGFNETPWLGGIYDPSSPTGTAVISTSINSYTPQRWIFTPTNPSPEPDLKVSVKYPSVDPYAGEQIPLTIYVDEGLQYVNLNDFSIKLSLPQNLLLSSISGPANQTLSVLPGTTRTPFQWFINTSKTGLYNINVSIASDNLTRILEYSFPLRIFDGRAEISMPNIAYFTPQDQLSAQGSIKYYGESPELLDINYIIEDYIWGNHGNWIQNISVNSGDTYNFNYLSGATGYKAGESGIYALWAYNQNHTTLVQDYMLIKIYSALLNATDLQVVGNNIVSNVSVRGNDYINNIDAKLFLYGSEIQNSEKFLGTLAPNSPQQLAWKLDNLPNQSIITLEITGNGVPSIEKNYELLIYTTPVPVVVTTTITQSGSTVTTTTTSTETSTSTVVQPASVVTTTETSVSTATSTSTSTVTTTVASSNQQASSETTSGSNTGQSSVTTTSSKGGNSPGFEIFSTITILLAITVIVVKRRRNI